MTDLERKQIADLLDAVNKGLDASKSFSEKVQELTNKLEGTLPILIPGVSASDPEVKEMIKRAVVVEEDKPIVFADKGYTPWLNSARAGISWDFYNRYEKYLVKAKRWNWGTVKSINETTDIILDHMHNPKSEDFFGVKGLVMGDIQSGKTANYTALINKALDAGYKLIIVLAGLTKDLRSQTQKRLDKEVLGYETRVDFSRGKTIGVGDYGDAKSNGDPLVVNAITNSGEGGDLNKRTAEAFGPVLNNGMQPLIAVLKKNSSVLKALNEDILSSKMGAKTNGKFDVPVLIIDDEVDQASVNTKEDTINEASTINKLIRLMLQKFNRFTYVGYTATPFANVFINPYGFDKEDEKDLFPDDFIVCLARPQSYCGVAEYFGIESFDSSEDEDAPTLDLYEKIDDYMDLFGPTVKRIQVDTPVTKINKSLEKALLHFVIASAVKYSRGIYEHNSMLIHIARFKNPATSLRDLVKDKLEEMQQKFLYGTSSEKAVFKSFWEKNIKPVSQGRLLSQFNDSWEEIEKHINNIFNMSIENIKVVNGDTADVCDYESSDVGQHIVIGGDKLSRGLTLEGLIVSYYNRNSKQYDTLLQMGRWFGYRDGWIDLCRVYTTDLLVNSFINAGLATEMFKKDIEEMNALKLTPSEFGLKVKHSPNLAPTSRSKMKSAKRMKVSFSGKLQQLLSYKKSYVADNRKTTEDFLRSLPTPETRANGNVVFKNVSADDVIDYLKKYKECDELVGSVSIKNWINYIAGLKAKGELVDWTVVLHSNSAVDPSYKDELAGFTIYKNQNTDRNLYANDDEENLYLKAVTSPSDFKEFYDPKSTEYKTIDCYKADDAFIEKTFTKEHGLLAIYSIDFYQKEFDKEELLSNGKMRKKYKRGKQLAGGAGVIGLGAWFSKTADYEASAVEFYVNDVYQKQLDEMAEPDGE